MNDYRIPHNPIFDNPKNSSSISNESPHPTKKEKKKIKKNLPRRGPRSRETFFQAPDRPLPTAGASPRSPSSRNAIGFCRRSGSTYRHRPTGTRGTRPASIEDRLRSAGISAMPAASVEQNDAENESSGEAWRGEARRGEERREEESGGERGHRGAWWGLRARSGGRRQRGSGTRRARRT